MLTNKKKRNTEIKISFELFTSFLNAAESRVKESKSKGNIGKINLTSLIEKNRCAAKLLSKKYGGKLKCP